MRLTALDYGGGIQREFVNELTATGGAHGTAVDFTSIHIFNVDGTDTTITAAELVLDTAVEKDGFTFKLNADGSVDITGLGAKDWVEWTTEVPHDRVLVEVLSGKWDIGGFEVEQLNTETAAIGGQIRFGDDAPTVDLTVNGTAELVLDESVGADANDPNADDGAPLAQKSFTSAQYLSATTAAFGTDGAGAAATDDVWSLSTVAGADSGLVALESGNKVYLFLVSGEIVGREGTSAQDAATGDVVLRFAIDADTGTVTVTQYLALQHDDATDSDDAVGLTGTGLVVVTRTLKDGDNDPASDTADLTGLFAFEDDGPTVTGSGSSAPTLYTEDSDFDGDDFGDFSDLFDTDYGTDGQATSGALVFELGVKDDGIASGLYDTATGLSISLRMNGDAVEGYVTGDTSLVAFVITVDESGVVTLDQRRAVVHDDETDPVEDGASAAKLSAADLVTLTATATDGDGDSASHTVDIGLNFAFGDDGPDVTLATATITPLETDDSTLGSDGPVDMSDLFDVDYGNDGPGDGFDYALGVTALVSGLTDTLTGDRILLRVVDGAVEGYLEDSTSTLAFRITVDASGGVSLEQLRSIVHDDPQDGEETGANAATLSKGLITLTAAATDGDGDGDSATAQIGDLFRFADDAPTVTPNSEPLPVLVTDDTNLPEDSDDAAFDGLFDIDTGNDGAGSTPNLYELGIKDDDAPTGLYLTETGDEILLRVVGGAVEGYVPGAPDTVAFTIAVDADGKVTLTQYAAIRHDDPADPDETQEDGKAQTMAADLVTLSLTTWDGDGDSDKATIDIGDAFHFEDDGPDITTVAGTLPVLTVSDATLNAAGPISFAGFFDPDYGNDGQATTDAIIYALSVSLSGADSGLKDAVTGDAILLRADGDTVEGYLANDSTVVAFTVTVDAQGGITLDQLRAIEHNDPTDPVESGGSAAAMTVAGLISLTATITDGDGDQDSASLGIATSFHFTDDGPDLDKPQNLVVDFPGPGSDSSDSKTLSFDTGNDGYGDLKITGYEAELTVNNVLLKGVLNSAGTLLTYYRDANGNGAIDAGETAFTYELKDMIGGDGKLDTAVFTVLNVPMTPSLDYNFRDLPAGQNGFGILAGRTLGATAPDPNSPSILIVGNDTHWNADGTFSNISSTVNTSKGGGPTTIGVSNQMIDPGEAVWFTYLTNPVDSFVAGVTNGLSQSEADNFNNIQFTGGLTEVTEAFFSVVQVQGNPKIAEVQIRAYDLDDTKNLQGTAMVTELNAVADDPSADEQVDIIRVWINGTDYDRGEGAGLLEWEDDGSVTLLALMAGDTIKFETDVGHDAALITGQSGKFDIGDYGIDQTFDTPDTMLDVTLTLTDGDGDTSSETHSILVDGTGFYNDGVLT